MELARRCVITLAYALAWLGLALLVVRHLDAGFPEPSDAPVALCPNVDSIRIHSRHWDQTKRPVEPLRTIAAPTPEECQ